MDNNSKIIKKKNRLKSDFTIEHLLNYVNNRIKKEDSSINIKLIRKVIKRYFQLCLEDLTTGNVIYFKNKLGNLYVNKTKREITYNPETNEIINNLPVNIAETLKLWRERPELKKIKYIRYTNEHSNNYVFNLKYEISFANFKNKQYYDFKYSSPVRKKLNENIINKKIEVFVDKYTSDSID